MGLYESVADLPLRIESESRKRRAADTTSGFERVTTEISLAGDGAVGKGEDVTYDAPDHESFAATPSFDLAGEWTFDEFARHLGSIDLFPADPPTRAGSRNYRRWAYESAALDLALRQAGTNLGSVLGRDPSPLRFVVSTRLGDPPTPDRVESLLEADPTLEFKLDPTPSWTPELIETLAGTDAVRVLDLKGWYEGTDVDVPADPDLYRRVLEAFPDAVVEDPAFTERTEGLLGPEASRLAFDYPVTGVSSLRNLPVEPGWCNVKPSRFGSVRSLFETIEYCWDADVRLYGGGQFELGVGRETIQLLAALLYPDGPNDVAPRRFNDPSSTGPYPSSPLEESQPVGARWD